MANVVSVERLSENNIRQTLDDGSIQLVNQRGQNYFDRDANAYLESDSAIQPDETIPGFTHNVKAGSARTRFAPGGKFRFGLRHPLYVTYVPRGAAAVAATVAGNRATFPGLWPGVDVELVKSPERVKETLTLADASAPSSYAWDLEEIAGVVPTPAVDGGLDYVETLTGNVVGRIPAPTVEDAAGVQGAATLTYEAGAITVDIDPAWLADPARAFPVTLDPTTYTVQPDPTAGLDAFVDSLSPDTNFGSNVALQIGWDVTNARYYRSYVAFTLPALPTGAAITAATISLAKTGATSSASFNLHGLTAAWGEGTITANTQPTFDAAATSSASAPGGTPNWAVWNVKALVQAWYAGRANYGVVVKSATESGGVNTADTFASSDYIADTSLRPKLIITTTAAPTAAVTNPTGASSAAPTTFTDDVTPTLTGTYASSDAVAQAKYRFRIYDASGNLVADQGLQAGAANSWAVPLSAGLKYGVPYQVTLYVEDANGGYGTSPAKWMKFVMSAPTGLGATENPGSARIDLAWNPHPGQNLAGYRVYRRESGAVDWELLSIGVVSPATVDTYYFLSPEQISLIVETHYHDRIAKTDVTYEYEVTAVATDGYESPKSATASASVTIRGFWVEDTQVHLVEAPAFEYPRRSSAAAGTTGAWLIQDLGLQGRRLQLRLQFRSHAEREALLALFPAGTIFSYRDQEGNACRGAVIGTISEQRTQRTAEFYGSLQLEAVEVTAG